MNDDQQHPRAPQPPGYTLRVKFRDGPPPPDPDITRPVGNLKSKIFWPAMIAYLIFLTLLFALSLVGC